MQDFGKRPALNLQQIEKFDFWGNKLISVLQNSHVRAFRYFFLCVYIYRVQLYIALDKLLCVSYVFFLSYLFRFGIFYCAPNSKRISQF